MRADGTLQEHRTEPAPRRSTQAAASAGHDSDAIVDVIEMLFFAYRDFTTEPDEILRELGFGRAHHRVLHFVSRRPGLRVADLLEILRITKQSLSRVLRQLIDSGLIEQAAGQADRRERRLFVTADGAALYGRLLDTQMARIGPALAMVGPEQAKVVERFLMEIIDEEERAHITTAHQIAEDAAAE